MVPEQSWEETWDVIVVGAGYAGLVAAIAAHDIGARVVVLEKMPDPGGISICSAGGLRIADDADVALAYLQATNAGTTPDAVLRALAEGMVRLPVQIETLAQVNGAVVGRRLSPGNYPFPGHDRLGFVYVDDIPGFEPAQAYPQVRGSPAGARLFKVLEDNVRVRGVPVRVSTPVRRLIAASDRRVRGVLAEMPGGMVRLHARRGVVLACGGFEGAPTVQRQFWPAHPVLPAAFRGNTGDGLRMAQALGADLWHMWHFHGSYGFRHPDPAYPFGIRTKRVPDWLPGHGPPPDVKLPWILLDQHGRRFMNEYDPYLQDTGARPFDRYDPERQAHRSLPAWLVADDIGRRLYPFGRPTWHERGIGYEWSADNSAEIAYGLLRIADSVEALAAGLQVAPAVLAETLAHWNHACDAGHDPVYARPPTSMLPIRTPPYVYAEIWPVVSNTQGGPVHDAQQRILDVDGHPIPRLYAAGELGSAFGHLYLSGGNLAECFIGGTLAGRNAGAAR